MGYDNECVVNILSLPGEYFCPVCRTLIDPNEALQSQCTHLYCKPCLAYVVATTHACPYDGYLVTEADSKPLVESSKELAETIGKTAVHCLYHRSGCQWQGTLAESTVHCAGCNYGNSAVVCNRCGTQIIHRQVQDHAQICPGIQPQAQTAENAQAQAAAAANQDSSSSASAASTAAASTTATAVATPAAATTAAPSAPASSEPASAPSAASAATGQTQAQGGAVVYPQAAAQAPTPEQWYQQQQMQYQQYYQQYPGYDPYQQQYQQYAQYQQQAYPQYMQPQMQAAPQHVIPGQQQPQPYMQQPLPLPQPQPGQPQAQAQPQPQPQPQTQPQGPGAQPQLQQQHIPQLQPQPQPQPHPFPQLQAQPQPQVPVQLPQMQTQQPLVPPQQPQNHPPPHGHAAGQPYPQPQPHAAQARPPQLQAPPQHQQPIPPQQLPQQMPHPQAYPQPSRPQHPPQNQPLPHPPPQPQLQQVPMQVQPQPQPHHHSQPIPQMQPPQPPAHAVPGYQSYPQPIPGPPQQRPMHMHPQQQGMPPQHPLQSQSQFPPQQPPQMRPPNSQMQMPVQQQPAMPPPQGPHANLHPSQQQVQHPVHQPGQQVFPQSSMQPHGNHGFPQPQAQGTLHPSHPLQQGPVPPQHQLHPQQSLRSQGPAYMQQPTPGQPHPQLNAPPAQGLPQHQAQARPMMVSQGMSQQPVPQSPGAGLKLMQPGANQQSPNQNYMGRANPAASMSSLLQSGSLQQSQLPHSGSQGGLVPASPATPKQGTSSMDDGKTMKNAEGIETGEKISEDMFESKSKGDEGKDVAELKEKDGQAENGSKDVLETLEKEGNVDRPMVKQLKVEEGANRSGEFTKTSHGLNVAGGEKEIQIQEGKRDAGSDKSVQRDSLRPNLERTNQGYVSDGQLGGTVGNNMHPQQMQAPGSLDRGQLQQQPTHQNVIPAQGHGYPQPGYNDRNPPQFPQQYPGSDDRQMPPGVPQQIPYGHPPHMSEPAMMSQRPPAPDRMFPQPLHQSSQERRFPDPSSYQMHVHGQAMPPSQMRPPGHNVRETFPHQGQMPVAQEPFWPPPHAGVSGPGPLPSSGGVPSHHGFPPKGFDQQAMAPQGQAQSHLPPPHVGGARTALGDPLARPFMGGPPPGPLDAPSRMMGGPPFISEDKVGKSATVNAIEAESHKRPGVYDGRQLEPHRPLPTEHAPYREPNIMKMNGVSNNVPVGGMHDSALPRGLPEDRFMPLPEERFKPFPEEGFKAAHDERFRPSSLDPGRHMVNRREFEEDLKQFPRPTHLVGEGPPEFDSYLSSSRPLDRMAQQPRGPNAMTSRPMSSYHSGAPFPPGIGGSEVHMDIGDRDRPIAFPEHLGRRHDGTFPHPDRLNLVPEFGRHRADGLPPLRSPGHFSRDIPDGLPSHLRRGMDGLGPLGPGSSSNIRGGEIVGSQNMPGFVRGGGFGGFRSHLDIGEPGGPGNLPSHLRIGDPGFNGRFSSASREGEIDSFEQSRKRKAGSMVRCLICKIDCETVEGLELHSQGREHQKMAMDMVLSIKKENAKKHRTSENSTPFEGANKSRKANFEKRANRQ